MPVKFIFYLKNKEKLFLYLQKHFRSDLGNENYRNMIFPGFPVFPVQEIDHFSCFPAGNSNTRKCATLVLRNKNQDLSEAQIKSLKLKRQAKKGTFTCAFAFVVI